MLTCDLTGDDGEILLGDEDDAEVEDSLDFGGRRLNCSCPFRPVLDSYGKN